MRSVAAAAEEETSRPSRRSRHNPAEGSTTSWAWREIHSKLKRSQNLIHWLDKCFNFMESVVLNEPDAQEGEIANIQAGIQQMDSMAPSSGASSGSNPMSFQPQQGWMNRFKNIFPNLI